ncbi:extracellular solute-binding protein [Streptomyces sp. NPDC059009]|uniref:extracellular solute-binding protein n=1 Tax=Streptomyces sp. NPDC059009 TaxID=3346694 RepID=UPI0036787458
MSRLLRAALVCCLLAVTALGAGGCAAPAPRKVVVLGPWTDAEGKAFRAVLARLDAEDDSVTYEYEGTRSLRETLIAKLEAGDPPDVAVLNSIGELSEYAADNRLKPLDGTAASRAFAPWVPKLVVNRARSTYWVPLKVDVKSLVWSKKGTSATDPRWCVGMASEATSGWPGTDWIEDIVLHLYGRDVYKRWAAGELPWTGIRGAWEKWGRMLEDGHGTYDPTGPLGMPYKGRDERGLLNSLKGCTHEHQSAFIRHVYVGDQVRVQPSAAFIGGGAGADTFEVSGDMAAVFTDRREARELVDRLSSPAARKEWREAAQPGLAPFFPARSDPQPEDREGAAITRILTRQAKTLCFDASDVMPPRVRDAFHRAVLSYFGDPTAKNLTPLLDQLDQVRDEERKKAPAHILAKEICESPAD